MDSIQARNGCLCRVNIQGVSDQTARLQRRIDRLADEEEEGEGTNGR